MSSVPLAADLYVEPSPATKNATAVRAKLTQSEGYVFRTLWYSRGNRPPHPEVTAYNPAALLMKTNGFRLNDGLRPITSRQFRKLVTALAGKKWIEFRPNRRRRNPTGEAFRRGTYVGVPGALPADADYLERGREFGQTHVPRRQKVPLTDTRESAVRGPRESAVRGREVTYPQGTVPSRNEKNRPPTPRPGGELRARRREHAGD